MTLIFLGDNILESGIVWSKGLFDAKEAGTKVITIDPRFSPTASKSHQWIPVKPGTDAALILGMIKLIIDEKWYDEEFMAAYTVFPPSDRSRNRRDRRRGGEKVDAKTGRRLPSSSPMCGIRFRILPNFTQEGVVPALEGSWIVDGKEVSN